MKSAKSSLAFDVEPPIIEPTIHRANRRLALTLIGLEGGASLVATAVAASMKR
jgi:hypothetical protein